jgi:putative lipase involved disintegration of autophagic bodies
VNCLCSRLTVFICAKVVRYIWTDLCHCSIMSYTEDYIKSKLLKELEATHVVSNFFESSSHFPVNQIFSCE